MKADPSGNGVTEDGLENGGGASTEGSRGRTGPGTCRDKQRTAHTRSAHPEPNPIPYVDVDEPAPSQACTTTPSANCRRVARRPSSPEPPIENILRRARRPPRAVHEGSGSDQGASPEPSIGPGQ
jgi:hypothetical protein